MGALCADGTTMGSNSLHDKDFARYFQEGTRRRRIKASDSFVKRAFDTVISLIAFIFLIPAFATISLLIWAQDGGSPFFVQERIGLNGRKFRCFKFRTMVANAAERLEQILASDPAARREWELDHKLRDDPRITWIGKFLRKTSLDELPQLINIIAGDMSIVGPRPIVAAEVERYGTFFRYYAEVRPGLTGLWQVSGRNDTTYSERVALDVRYVRNWSVLEDLRIIIVTVPSILFSRGAY